MVGYHSHFRCCFVARFFAAFLVLFFAQTRMSSEVLCLFLDGGGKTNMPCGLHVIGIKFFAVQEMLVVKHSRIPLVL